MFSTCSYHESFLCNRNASAQAGSWKSNVLRSVPQSKDRRTCIISDFIMHMYNVMVLRYLGRQYARFLVQFTSSKIVMPYRLLAILKVNVLLQPY